MSVDVIYFVESVPKELDVACIVTQLVERKFGLRVQIASYKDPAPEWLLREKPRLLVVPTCYAADGWGIKKHIGRWPNVPYLNLTWEELFSKVNETWKHPRDVFAQRHVMHHVWGDFYKETLMSYGVPEQNILVNGNPGIRLYQSPYKEYFPTRSELARRHQLDPAKRWILFPENYGYVFYNEVNVAARLRGGMDPEAPGVMREFCRNSMQIVLDWCRECARDESVEMIIRPRPTTPLSQFEQVSRELAGDSLERVRFIKDGPVSQWTVASDLVVSSFSSCLLEAAVAGKPAYVVEPIPMPESMWSVWYKEADCLSTKQAFLDACLNPLANASEQRLRTWADQNLLSRGDPIVNLVDIIGKICDGGIQVPAPGDMAPLVARPQRSRARSWLRDSWHDLKDLVAPPPEGGDKDTRVFGKRDVLAKMRSWEHVLNDSAS